MAVWIPPKTWLFREFIEASELNTEVRDKLSWLHNALKNITNDTIADSGTATFLRIVRNSSTSHIVAGHVSGEAQLRSIFRINGDLVYGAGSDSVPSFRLRSFFEASTQGLKLEREAGVVPAPGGLTPELRIMSGGWITLHDNTGEIGRWARNIVELSASGGHFGNIFVDSAGMHIQNVNQAVGVIMPIASGAGRIEALKLRRDSDTQPRLSLGHTASGDPGIMFGPGNASVDISLWRESATLLATGGRFWGLDGLVTKVVHAAIANGSYNTTPPDGTLGVDSLNGRLYFKYGGANHYVVRTAGFEIPEWERDCPQCGSEIVIGERVVGRVDEYQSDGARHGLWEHETCPS